MTESYPLPDYAVSIWVVGDNLKVAFTGPTGKGHTITLPTSVAGLATVIKILRQRQAAKDLRLSNPGTPSQYETEMLMNDAKYNAWLKAMGKANADALREKAEAEEFLKELGL